MSDCVFWAFQGHMRHLNLPVEPFAHELFKALRRPSLPEQRDIIKTGWWDNVTHRFHETMGEQFSAGREIRSFDFSYTNGAVAPIILHVLASYHGLRMRVQHDAWYPAEVGEQLATTSVQRSVARSAPEHFGVAVEKIDLAPAIYLCIEGAIGKHAHFAVTVPEKTNITTAFQLYDPRYENHDGSLVKGA